MMMDSPLHYDDDAAAIFALWPSQPALDLVSLPSTPFNVIQPECHDSVTALSPVSLCQYALPPQPNDIPDDRTIIRRRSVNVVQHRAIDAKRRRRERREFRRLRGAIEQNTTAQRRRDIDTSKLAVLKDANDTIARLRQQLAAQERRRHVTYHESFFTSLFALSSLIQMVVNADSGVCLSVNQAFGRFFAVDAHAMVGVPLKASRTEWLQHDADDVDDDRGIRAVSIALDQTRFIPVPKPYQTVSSKRLLSQLYRGEISLMESTLQARDGAGVLYDVRMRAWMSLVESPPMSEHSHSHVTLLHCMGQLLQPAQLTMTADSTAN